MKEEANKRRGTSKAMNSDTSSSQPSLTTRFEPTTSSMTWVILLQTRLRDCPTDTLARCALASLLEELEHPEEALCHWNAVLVCAPDSLKAQAGVVRCR